MNWLLSHETLQASNSSAAYLSALHGQWALAGPLSLRGAMRYNVVMRPAFHRTSPLQWRALLWQLKSQQPSVAIDDVLVLCWCFGGCLFSAAAEVTSSPLTALDSVLDQKGLSSAMAPRALMTRPVPPCLVSNSSMACMSSQR